MNARVTKPLGPDFCLVQLTAAGVAQAGKGSLRYSNGRQQFVFQPGEPVKVARYEWDLALAGHTTKDGKPLFELAGDAAPDPAPATAPAPTSQSSTSEAQSTAEEKK